MNSVGEMIENVQSYGDNKRKQFSKIIKDGWKVSYIKINKDLISAMEVGDISYIIEVMDGPEYIGYPYLKSNFIEQLKNKVALRYSDAKYIADWLEVYERDLKIDKDLIKIEMTESCWQSFRFWLSSKIGYCVNKELEQDFYLGDCVKYSDITLCSVFIGPSLHKLGLKNLGGIPTSCSNNFEKYSKSISGNLYSGRLFHLKGFKLQDKLFKRFGLSRDEQSLIFMDIKNIKNSSTFEVRQNE